MVGVAVIAFLQGINEAIFKVEKCPKNAII
jgi:hypothetical protein